jgi:hypothetical protein
MMKSIGSTKDLKPRTRSLVNFMKGRTMAGRIGREADRPPGTNPGF